MSDSPRLAAELDELIQENNLFVVLCLDGSGSVSASAFEEQRTAASLIINAFKKAMVTIIQFGSQARTVCTATTDTKLLIDELLSKPV